MSEMTEAKYQEQVDSGTTLAVATNDVMWGKSKGKGPVARGKLGLKGKGKSKRKKGRRYIPFSSKGKGKGKGKSHDSRCHICGSNDHWADQCPQNPGKGAGRG